ncbi:MAG: hypothetical protein QOD50_805 [Actinomycetota bacterium]|jgi:hypothetical protein|nr:hypothetical protein [Actinomycetota bacterium]
MSRRRVGLFSLVAMVFVVGGIFLASRGNWVGWLGIVFFGLGLLVFASELVHPSILVLDHSGFTSRPAWPGRASRTEWTECSALHAVDTTNGLGRQNMVLYVSKVARRSTFGRTNLRPVGGSDGLRAGYGRLSAVELAALMNRYRAASRGA